MTRDSSAEVPQSPADGMLAPWTPWVQPPRLFLLLALVFGFALCFLTAPFQTSDEQAHFYRAYQISEGQFAPVSRERFGGADLPESLERVGASFDLLPRYEDLKAKNPDVRKSDIKVSWGRIRDALQVPLNPDRRKFTRTVAEVYSPASYLPQASAIWIGRHYSLGPLKLMYLGRIANLLFWITLGYLALRIAPACRRPLLLLLLMPMTLFQAASNSCDPTTNALALLFAAMVLRYVNLDGEQGSGFGAQGSGGESIGIGAGAATRGNLPGAPAHIGFATCIAFAVVATMLALTKFVYLPMLALLFLVPASRLGGRRRYWIVITVVGLLSIAALLIWTVPVMGLDMVVIEKSGVNPAGQKEFLRGHPWHLWTMVTSTFLFRGRAIVQSFVGRLGRLDAPMSYVFVDAYLIAMVAACWFQRERLVFPRRWLAPIILVPVAISTFAITVLNYIYDNPVGKDLADGIQGRYLIPLAPAIIVLLWGLAPRRARQIARDMPGVIDLGTAVMAILSGICTLIVVCVRYYGPSKF